MNEPTLRWSSAVDCPRKAVYGATREPDRDWSDREARIMYRGRSIGHDYGTWLKAKYGPNAVWREVKVKWAMGVGHIDLFLRPTGTAIEVLSSKWASDEMVHRKLLQLVGYMEAYKPAKNGCLIVLDPADFTESRWPVAKNTDTYRALVEETLERVEQLKRWWDSSMHGEGGILPDRVCRKPSEAIGHFCRHAETCFADWVEPEPGSVVDDPDALALASQLHFVKGEERIAKAALADHEAVRKDLEAQLAALPGVEGVAGDIQIGSFVVKRVHVQRKPSLDTKKATLAGALNLELLAEFMKPGASYWTTAIERTETSGPVDFGDEAPWTDEDLLAAFEESTAA